MFHLSTMTPAPVKGKIRLTDPFKQLHLGPITDADGKRWAIRACGMDENGWWACAVPAHDLHPYFTDTSGACFGLVSQRWELYEIEEVK